MRGGGEIPYLFYMDILISCSSKGIGDHVTAIYAACGYADAGHQVEFTTPYYKWLERVEHPNLKITPERPCDCTVYHRYDEELVAAYEGTCKSRAHWYAQNISDYYGVPLAEPSQPKTINSQYKANRCSKPYVLIAPFSAGPSRAWEEDKWQYLAEDLIAKGYDVYAVCSKKEAYQLERMFHYLPQVIRGVGLPEESVLSVIHYAHRVVANDSSIAHLAALHRKHVTVVCSHVKPEFVFGTAHKYITTVSPDQIMYPCVWCCWTHDGGLRWGCFDRCDALQSIEHTKVIQLLQVD